MVSMGHLAYGGQKLEIEIFKINGGTDFWGIRKYILQFVWKVV